jgi:hypothetical protein
MRDLFSFPNPVNETSARLVAGAVAVLAVLTIAFQQGWVIPVLAYGFLARALTGPAQPLGLLATESSPRVSTFGTGMRRDKRSASRSRWVRCSR